MDKNDSAELYNFVKIQSGYFGVRLKFFNILPSFEYINRLCLRNLKKNKWKTTTLLKYWIIRINIDTL